MASKKFRNGSDEHHPMRDCLGCKKRFKPSAHFNRFCWHCQERLDGESKTEQSRFHDTRGDTKC